MLSPCTELEPLHKPDSRCLFSTALPSAEGFDRVEKMTTPVAKEQTWEAELYPGFRLQIVEDEYYETIASEADHDGFYSLVSKFYLSGHQNVFTKDAPGIPHQYQEVAGQNYLFFLPDIQEIEQFTAGQRLSLVRLEVELDCLRSLGSDPSTLPQPLASLFSDDSNGRFHQSLGAITPAMMLVLQQLIGCPYQGLTKRVYLQSKALELLALQFHQWSEASQPPSRCSLRRGDIDRIYHAKEILLQNLNNPPSLLELARQVGLNDYKLKQGFRQVFGTTVFGYLKIYRMKQAKQLLAQPELSVAGVAQLVGYASQSRFCEAFKQQFGMSPRDYRITLRC